MSDEKLFREFVKIGNTKFVFACIVLTVFSVFRLLAISGISFEKSYETSRAPKTLLAPAYVFLANSPPQFVDSVTGVHIQTLKVKTNKNTQFRIRLHIRDLDPDGYGFTSITPLAGLGTIQGISLTDTSFVYVPNLNASGIDTIKTIIHDNGTPELSDTLNIIVKIPSVNHMPVIVDSNNNQVLFLSEKIQFNTSKQICLNAYDVDDDVVTIGYVLTFPTKGTLSGFKALCFSYKPNNNYVGKDSMVVVFFDNGVPVLFNSIKIYFQVYALNTPPVVLDPQGNTTKSLIDTTLETVPLDMCLKTLDAQNDSVKILSLKSLAGHTQIDLIPGVDLCFKLSPIGAFYGKDSIEAIVADNGYPIMTNRVVIQLVIWHINRAPVILDKNNNPVDTLFFDAYENEPLQTCLNVTDIDNNSVRISGINKVAGNGIATVSKTDSICCDYTPPGIIGTETFLVQVSDNGYPSLHDSVVVIFNVLPRFVVSPSISPNNDGINDAWLIVGIERYPDNVVTIFSRWGDLIFKVKGYDNITNYWKGEFKNGSGPSGSEAPDGTYFYVIELGHGLKLSGFIILKR
jgi:gliding motility-associated-like protein